MAQKSVFGSVILAKIPCQVSLRNIGNSKQGYRSLGHQAQLKLIHCKTNNRIYVNVIYKGISIRIPQMPLLTLILYRCAIRPLLRTTKLDNMIQLFVPNKKFKIKVKKDIQDIRKQFLRKGKSYKFTGKIK